MKSIRFFGFLSSFLHKTSRLTITLSVLTLIGISQQLKAVDPMPGMSAPAAGFGGMLPDGTPSMAGLPGGMPPLPEGVSEADFQSMVDEISKQLEKMSPEEIEKLQKEAEEMLVNSGVSREEIESFKQGAAAGFPGEFPQPMAAPQVPAAVPAPVMQRPVQQEILPAGKSELPSIVSETEVSQLLKSIVRSATKLREQIALSDALKTLRPWRQSLDDIIFYVKVFDSKQEHRKRLATKEFATLYTLLKRFNMILEDQEQHLGGTVEEVSEEENPYDILRIPQTASDEEIEEAAQELLAEKDPKTLQKRLTEEGASELDIKRQVQSARTARAQIMDAYEKVTPKETRAQTDRRLKAQREQKKVSETALRSAATALNNGFSQINAQLARAAEEFLKKYEPAELARKKEMDAAEAKQRKEQEARAQLKPSPAPYLQQEFYPPAFEGARPSADVGRPVPSITPSSSDKGFTAPAAPEKKEMKPSSGEGHRDEKKDGEDKKKTDEQIKKDNEDKKKAEEQANADAAAKKSLTKAPRERSANEWNALLTTLDNALTSIESTFKPEELKALQETARKATNDETAQKELIQKLSGAMPAIDQATTCFNELGQMSRKAKLTEEELKKLEQRLAEITKKHASTIELIAALQPKAKNFIEKPKAKEEAEPSKKSPKKEREELSEDEQFEKGQKEFEEKYGKAAAEEAKKETETKQKEFAEVLQENLKAFSIAAPESEGELTALQKKISTFKEQLNANPEVQKLFPEQARSEISKSLEALSKEKAEQYATYVNQTSDWDRLNNTAARSENIEEHERQQLKSQAQTLHDDMIKNGYPDTADEKQDEFDLALLSTDTSLWGRIKYYAQYAKIKLRYGAEKAEDILRGALEHLPIAAQQAAAGGTQ